MLGIMRALGMWRHFLEGSRQSHNLIRSQKSDIFPKGTEVKLPTSMMGVVPHKVQHQVDACTWIQNGPIRHII